MTDEQHLRAIIAAFDEPHYGDLDAAMDTLFDVIEPARVHLASRDSPQFPIGHKFTSAGKAPRQCVVSDIHRTYNAAGDLVRLRYVAAHEFVGQTVLRYDVTDAEIAKGSA